MLPRMKASLVLVVLVLFPLSAALAADISGKWVLAVDLSAGSGNPKFEFKQEGEKLTGTYSGVLGKADVAGTVNGSRVEFHFKAEYGGDTVAVVYSGTIENATKMKGTVKYGDVGEGTWTGEKK